MSEGRTRGTWRTGIWTLAFVAAIAAPATVAAQQTMLERPAGLEGPIADLALSISREGIFSRVSGDGNIP